MQFVHSAVYDYDICLRMLFKCFAVYDSLIHRRNRPQWFQRWVVFRWGFWQNKFDIRTFSNFYELSYFLTLLNSIINIS